MMICSALPLEEAEQGVVLSTRRIKWMQKGRPMQLAAQQSHSHSG